MWLVPLRPAAPAADKVGKAAPRAPRSRRQLEGGQLELDPRSTQARHPHASGMGVDVLAMQPMCGLRGSRGRCWYAYMYYTYRAEFGEEFSTVAISGVLEPGASDPQMRDFSGTEI